ncbi:MAG: twin-arginine translocase TatA/TatE family subunit [Alphaproteobacteria bacterium]|nr:twin-arginine translocase TatA/TatE family subunit [Alphaproteobacteria bacterium]
MGAFSIWHWLIVLVVVLVLFGGRGKISSLMGDLGKGLKAFKSNLKEDASDSSTKLEEITADQPQDASSTAKAEHPSETQK